MRFLKLLMGPHVFVPNSVLGNLELAQLNQVKHHSNICLHKTNYERDILKFIGGS